MKLYLLLILVFSLFIWHDVKALDLIAEENLPDTTSGMFFTSSHSDAMYYADSQSRIYKLHGENWTLYTDKLGTYSIVDIVELKSGGIVVATGFNGIVRQVGNEFSLSNEGLTNLKLTALTADADENLYAGAWFEGGLFKSTDGGVSWELLGMTNTDISALHYFDGKIFIAVEGKGIFATSNGTEFKQNMFSLSHVYGFVDTPNGELLALTDGGVKLYDGEYWGDFSSTLGASRITNMHLGDSYAIFTDVAGKCYRSFDDFVTLDTLNINPDTKALDLGVSPATDIAYFSTVKGVYRTPIAAGKVPVKIVANITSNSIIYLNDILRVTVQLFDENDKKVTFGEMSFKNSANDEISSIPPSFSGDYLYEFTMTEDIKSGNYQVEFSLTDSRYQFIGNDFIEYTAKDFIEQKILIITDMFSAEIINIGSHLQVNLLALGEKDMMPIEGVSIAIFNSVDSEINTLITDHEGRAFYKYVIPEGTVEGDYYLGLTASHQDLISSDEVVIDFKIDFNAGVESISENTDIILINNTLTYKNIPYDSKLEIYNLLGIRLYATELAYSSGMDGINYNLIRGVYFIVIRKNNNIIFTKKIQK